MSTNLFLFSLPPPNNEMLVTVKYISITFFFFGNYLQVHYYEDGNVQLVTSKEVKENLKITVGMTSS